jgi:hypothetical protein
MLEILNQICTQFKKIDDKHENIKDTLGQSYLVLGKHLVGLNPFFIFYNIFFF